MEPGLYLFRLRGGWYGRGVTCVGWIRPHRGDWWHLVGARNLVRVNNDLTPIGLLASRGMTKNHKLTEPAGVEVVHVMSTIMRAFPADLAKWEKHCPRPDDWQW